MKRACVIGWPIEHSRSPLIHGYWLARYEIDGAYTKEAVPPEALASYLTRLAENGLQGCNVTVPHKEAALRLADDVDESARGVGAVNTLWLEGSRLCGSNTDTYGFMTYLGLSAPSWRERDAPVAILGAGGAARAIVLGFLKANITEIRVFNRTRARAEALALHFGDRIKVYDWHERTQRTRDCGVLVNATAAGLKGAGSIGIDFSGFRRECVVCDIVYVPLETELLRGARAAGLQTVDGLGMLLHQAVPGFHKWFGKQPEVTTDLYRRIATDIEAHTW